MSDYKLMRTWYRTDYSEVNGQESVGMFSEMIPGRVIRDGWQVVAVDWSKPGEVEVTWLVPQ